MKKNFYKILETEKSATTEEIRKAYKKLALKWHPDKWADKSKKEQEEAEEEFKIISNAYEILSSPEERKKYDEKEKQSNNQREFRQKTSKDFPSDSNQAYSREQYQLQCQLKESKEEAIWYIKLILSLNPVVKIGELKVCYQNFEKEINNLTDIYRIANFGEE